MYHPVEFIAFCREEFKLIKNYQLLSEVYKCIVNAESLARTLNNSTPDTCVVVDPKNFPPSRDLYKECFIRENITNYYDSLYDSVFGKDVNQAKSKYLQIQECGNIELWRLDCLSTFINHTTGRLGNVSSNVTRCYTPSEGGIAFNHSWFIDLNRTSILRIEQVLANNYTYYNCTDLNNKYDLMISCKSNLERHITNASECSKLECHGVSDIASCAVRFYNISLPLSNITIAEQILNSICNKNKCDIVRSNTDQYLQGCTEFNIKALRPTFLALDFVNRGEDRDEHVANCFFGDLDKRKELGCEKIIYEYIECNGVTKQVLNATDYDCALNHN